MEWLPDIDKRNDPTVLFNNKLKHIVGKKSRFFYMVLKYDGDVSPLKHPIILGHECIVIVYVSQILSWLITSPLIIHVK